MTVYHWTTRENAKRIIKEGLREGSFVCAEPNVWHGEVCLVIESMKLIVDEETWQGGTHRHVSPDEIEFLEGDEDENRTR